MKAEVEERAGVRRVGCPLRPILIFPLGPNTPIVYSTSTMARRTLRMEPGDARHRSGGKQDS